MKTKFIFGTVFTTIFLVSIIACGSDNSSSATNGCNGLTYAGAFQGEQYQDLLDASTNFGEEQTAQSCEVYKSELQGWFNVLQGLSSDCIGVPEEEYQASLADAQESIDEIDCSQYEGN